MPYESLLQLLGLSVLILQATALLIFQTHSELQHIRRRVKLVSKLVACYHDLKNE